MVFKLFSLGNRSPFYFIVSFAAQELFILV